MILNIEIKKILGNWRDAEKVVSRHYQSLGYLVKRGREIDDTVGVPDFFMEKSEDKFFVEVKTPWDSLRVSQMEWLEKNSGMRTIVAIVDIVGRHCLQQTIILEQKLCSDGLTRLPVIACAYMEDGIHAGFWCEHCEKIHLHGWKDETYDGHRVAHCFEPTSPFYENGYFIEVVR